MTEAHAERSHARLSPSAAHRWLECPGSIKASEGIEQKTSRAADEGTAAHMLAEHCFKYKFDTDSFISFSVSVATGEVGIGTATAALLSEADAARCFEVTEEMAEGVQIYLDHIRDLCTGDDAEVESETKLDLSHIEGMDFGTGDFSAYHPATGELHICDFKYGKGVVVEAERNPQLMTYASGVMRRYANRGLRQITLWVVQPRAQHRQGSVRPWTCHAVDLMDFEEDLRDGAALALSDDAPRKAGDWCKFCPVAAVCETHANAAQLVAMDVFGEMIDPADLSPDELAEKLDRAHTLKNWLGAFFQYAHDQALAGNVPTNYKLVAKRATRKWDGDADTVVDDLGVLGLKLDDLLSPRELKSPAQVEGLMPGKNKKERAAALAPFVKQVSTGTNLVPLSDARAPARPLLEDIFE